MEQVREQGGVIMMRLATASSSLRELEESDKARAASDGGRPFFERPHLYFKRLLNYIRDYGNRVVINVKYNI